MWKQTNIAFRAENRPIHEKFRCHHPCCTRNFSNTSATTTMIKLVRGCRVLRVGRGRVLRILMVTVLLIIAWQTLLSGNRLKNNIKTYSDDDGVSSSFIGQVAAPRSESRSSPILANHLVDVPGKSRHSDEVRKMAQEREAVLKGSNNINPRYNVKAIKDKLEEVHLKPIRNQHFLHQNQLNLIDDFQEEDDDENDLDDEDNDDYGEDEDEDEGGLGEEGKWNGRNQVDNKDDVAIEEEDELANENFDLEDVGGEKFKDEKDDKDKKKKFPKKEKKEEKEELDGDGDRVVGIGELMGEMRKDEIDELMFKSKENKNAMDDVGEEESHLDMEAVEKELSERRSRVREVCGKYGIGPHAPTGGKPSLKHPPTVNYEVFYIDRKEELAWCPIYKAASTSWLYNFLILGGFEETDIKNAKEQISTIARRVWPPLDYEDAEEAFRSCLKFMIVRHPFERIVSAYRDKLENTNIGKEHGVDHFYKKYGSKIVMKFRPPGHGLPANRYSQDMDDPSIPAPKGIEPTFEEFVKYLIATDLVHYADDHWMPYYLHCTPCILDYDVLAKFETLERDQNYIIKKKHLEDRIRPSWKHLTKGIKTSDTIRKYFATITKKDLKNLYDKYKLDFELFDYSIDEYLTFVKES